MVATINLRTIYMSPEGEVSQGFPWTIEVDYRSQFKCRHCRPVGKDKWGIEQFECPRVVVSQNEGGCASTATCFDCIIEAQKQMESE